MSFRAGTWPWLLRHEIRLAWRGLGSKGWQIAAVFGVITIALHVAAWFMLRSMNMIVLPPAFAWLFGVGTWVAMTLMLSQAIILSVDVLFNRGDLDLLLASPISPRTVFKVRGLGIAVSSGALYLLLAAPFANAGVFTGHPQLLAIYPAILALALLVTAVAMWLTLSLVRWLGARRARVAAQLLSALIGASIFLVSQSQTLLGTETGQWLLSEIRAWLEPVDILNRSSLIWLPTRALSGDPVSLIVLVIMGVGSFWLVTMLACNRFLAGTQASVSGGVVRSSSTAGTQANFRGGLLRNVLVKEWKLIFRDPNLIAQSLLQVLYLLPLMFLVLRNHSADGSMIVPACIWIAANLASNISWITVAAEEAHDLIGTAPVRLTKIRWFKVLAALLPIWALMLPIVVYMFVDHPVSAIVFFVCLVGATVSAGIMQVWYPQRGQRADLKRRSQSGGIVMAVLELGSAVSWGLLAMALLNASLLSLVALPFALAGLVATWFYGRSKRGEEVAILSQSPRIRLAGSDRLAGDTHPLN